jgi:hypothetical protein
MICIWVVCVRHGCGVAIFCGAVNLNLPLKVESDVSYFRSYLRCSKLVTFVAVKQFLFWFFRFLFESIFQASNLNLRIHTVGGQVIGVQIVRLELLRIGRLRKPALHLVLVIKSRQTKVWAPEIRSCWELILH